MNLFVALLHSIASAQCVQCFRTAAAQQQAGILAMNHAILVLLIPVFTLLAGFCWLVWRRREP